VRQVLFRGIFALFAVCALGQQPLSNESVAKLSNAGVTDEVIVQLIRTQPGHYDVVPDALVTLKKSGVRDGVIAAIINRENSALSANSEMPAPQVGIPAPTSNEGLTRRPSRFRSDSNSLVLEDATPITLRVVSAASSETAKLGDVVALQVSRAVSVSGTVIIPRGAKAVGTITTIKHKGALGRGGTLRLAIDSVSLADGTEVPVRSTSEANFGIGRNADSIPFSAGTRWATIPFLALQGKDAVIPHGAKVTAYVDGDFSPTPVKASLTGTTRPE
jgi:hypothetical protein